MDATKVREDALFRNSHRYILPFPWIYIISNKVEAPREGSKSNTFIKDSDMLILGRQRLEHKCKLGFDLHASY